MLPLRLLVRPLRPPQHPLSLGLRTFSKKSKLKPKPKPKALPKPASKPKSAPKAAPKSAPNSAPKSALPPPPPSLTTLLSQASGPTLLYAKHSGKFLAASYTVAAAFGYMCWDTYESRIAHPPVPLPTWMRGAFFVTIGVTGAFAAFFAWRPVMYVLYSGWGKVGVNGRWEDRLLQKIYAHPVAGAPGTVKFVLHRRPILPGLPDRKITVAHASDITLSRVLQPVVAAPTMAKKPQIGGVKRMGRMLLEAPFTFFHAAKNLVVNDEFVTVKVKGGGTYSLHQDGWVWERRGIDRLFGTKAATKY
ncbi:hypothetical protein BZA05DRAFT_387044 [Tricharina praecox]|uniref:uncharacterized protein n=1 Tax=Tricharina praecox TaxID=43433 RepID=UPI00221E441D|nr:uncharacterized protein BZA05DRAFT_387044 [Tricharina praecox]KAI5857030.1 hypothetical protein BZA05DRAFT_387044 [Tricharina praecox]